MLRERFLPPTPENTVVPRAPLPPPSARLYHRAMRNLLTDISGIAVGHATDLAVGTGATAIIFDQAAVASAVILGGAPGSRDTALLEPEMTQQRVNAFVFSGGSIYGLDAAGGVQAWLREQGRGQQQGGAQHGRISTWGAPWNA